MPNLFLVEVTYCVAKPSRGRVRVRGRFKGGRVRVGVSVVGW